MFTLTAVRHQPQHPDNHNDRGCCGQARLPGVSHPYPYGVLAVILVS